MSKTRKASLEPSALQPILDTLQGESDRACAVLGVATVDAFLEGLLRAAMIEDVPAEVFENNGACSTLSSKIDLAFALGLIPAEDRRDLHLVRKIRNDFAHAVDHTLSFAHPEVVSRVNALAIPKLLENRLIAAGENVTPRFRFTLAIGVLTHTLGGFRRNTLKRPSTPVSLKAGPEGASSKSVESAHHSS